MHQLHRLQRQTPLTPKVFRVGADEDAFRYGTVLSHEAKKEKSECCLDT